MTTQEARELWLAANDKRAAYRAQHGEDESPEYERLAEESNYWLFELLALRVRDEK